MPYIVVDNFQGGLDDRRSAITSAPGTLTAANNVHLTPGGEVEKRKAFFPLFTFPIGFEPVGMKGGSGNDLYLFGNGARPAGLPTEFKWVNVAKGGTLAVRLLECEFWSGEQYALIEYADGSVSRWYNYSLISEAATWELTPEAGKLRDILILGTKAYGIQGSIVNFSGVGEPVLFGTTAPPAVGSGFFDVSWEFPGSFDSVALAAYQNKLAVFAKKGVMIYGVDPDPIYNTLFQVVPEFGCAASRSVTNYGDADVLFLSYSGVRSLRARDSSNMVQVDDVGSPIDQTLQAHMALILDKNNVADAVGLYEPNQGRFWLSMFDVIYVFSYFPKVRVAAWTTYTPGFRIRDMASADNKVFILSDDTLYSYGAYKTPAGVISQDTDYDSSPVEIITPYLDNRQPATQKTFKAIDLGIEGEWAVYASMNPSRPDVEELIGRFTGQTFSQLSERFSGLGSHVRFRLTHEREGYARLGNLAVHYQNSGAE